MRQYITNLVFRRRAMVHLCVNVIVASILNAQFRDAYDMPSSKR